MVFGKRSHFFPRSTPEHYKVNVASMFTNRITCALICQRIHIPRALWEHTSRAQIFKHFCNEQNWKLALKIIIIVFYKRNRKLYCFATCFRALRDWSEHSRIVKHSATNCASLVFWSVPACQHFLFLQKNCGFTVGWD